MPLPQSTTKEAATGYLKKELGYTDPDAGEIQGAQDELNALIGKANALESGANLLASSRSARMSYGQNAAKLEQATQRVTGAAQNYGAVTVDPKTGKTTQADINDPSALAGDGFKFAYYADGTKMQIPKGSNAASYGMSDNPPAVKTSGKPDEKIDPNVKSLNDATSSLTSQEKESTAFYEDFKTRQDALTANLISNIQAKYQARRAKMEDINKRYLEGKRTAGASSGRMEYATTMQDGLLATEELDGQQRLAEIDAEEQELILKAKQAQSESGYKAFNDYMTRLDKIGKDKLETITKLHNIAVEADKTLEEKRRNAIADAKTQADTAQKTADSIAASALSGYSTLKTDKEKESFLEALSTKFGVDVEVIRSSMIGAQQEGEKTTLDAKYKQSQIDENYSQIADRAKNPGGKKTVAEKQAEAFQTINKLVGAKNADGMPYLDAEGYFTAQGFKDLITASREDGISRKEFLAEYATYLSPWGAKAYGLTPAEQKLLQDGGAIETIDEQYLKDVYNLDGKDLTEAQSFVGAKKKVGMTDKEIAKLLDEKYL